MHVKLPEAKQKQPKSNLSNHTNHTNHTNHMKSHEMHTNHMKWLMTVSGVLKHHEACNLLDATGSPSHFEKLPELSFWHGCLLAKCKCKKFTKKKCSFHKWKMMKAKNHAEKGFTVQKKHLKTCKSIAIGLTQVTCHVSCDSCVSGALNSNLMPSKRWLAMATSVCRPLPRPPSNSAWLRLKAPTLRRPSKPKHRAEQFFEGKTSKTYKVTSIHISYIESRQVSCRRSYLTTQIGCKESNEQRNNWNNHKLNRVLQEQKQQTWLASKRS